MRKATRAFVLLFIFCTALSNFSEAAPRLPDNLRTTPAPVTQPTPEPEVKPEPVKQPEAQPAPAPTAQPAPKPESNPAPQTPSMSSDKIDEFIKLCQNGTPEEVEAAIKAGADVNAKGDGGITPLVLAIGRGSPDNKLKMLSLLLEAGADVNVKTSVNESIGMFGQTPLMVAASEPLGQGAVEMLLYAGAELDAKDSRGKTVIDYAQENTYTDNGVKNEIVALLDAHAKSASAPEETGPVSDVSDALSARPDGSIYITARVDDVNGMLRGILSQANIDLITPMIPEYDREEILAAISLFSQIPAESVAFIAGVEKSNPGAPFFQAAVSVADEFRPELNRIAKGEAVPLDLDVLMLGKAALKLDRVDRPSMRSSLEQGAKGPYYRLDPEHDLPFVAARNGLLLISMLPQNLDASIEALEDSEKRLALKRRFDAPNNFLIHADIPTLTAMSAMLPDSRETREVKGLMSLLNPQAPLKLEAAFEAKPGKFTVSSHLNWMEAFGIANEDGENSPKTAPGAGLFLAGEGQLFSALAVPTSFSVSSLNVIPELYAQWQFFVQELAKRGIAEKDVEDLLTGTFSFALGGGSTVMGMRLPGAYIALSGQNGAAAKILSKAAPELPLMPVKAEGWDALFMAPQNMVPASLLLGVSGETLFLGLTNPEGLGKMPVLSAEATAFLKEPSVGMGFIDPGAIWAWLKGEVSNQDSALNSIMKMGSFGTREAELLQNLMDSELSVPFMKVWAPDLETSFTEFTIADVPPEKGILFKIISATMAMM